jgi:hypothetical protein
MELELAPPPQKKCGPNQNNQSREAMLSRIAHSSLFSHKLLQAAKALDCSFTKQLMWLLPSWQAERFMNVSILLSASFPVSFSLRLRTVRLRPQDHVGASKEIHRTFALTTYHTTTAFR